MVTIRVNDKEHQFKTPPSLEEVLDQLQFSLNGIAVAVNQQIISKPHWSRTSLSQNDKVLVITATQGG